MLIGEMARRTGASIKAIRLYESLGLLGRVERSNRYRVYTAAHLQQVLLIRRARQLGFKLAELQDWLGVPGRELAGAELMAQLEVRRADIQRQMVHLQQQDQLLQLVIEEISDCTGTQAEINRAVCVQDNA